MFDDSIMVAESANLAEEKRIKDQLNKLISKLEPEEKALIEALRESAFSYIFILAWTRARLESNLKEDVMAGLQQMMDEGEDDFESHAPALAELYTTALHLERLYAEIARETRAKTLERRG